MALTRITKGVIKPNEDFETRNVNSTGIVTATGLDVNGNADISGSLSVGGVLTYEDVTSIDSVGIITARSGLVSPNADIDDFVSVGNNIHLGNAGVITATSFVGSGAALTGIDATAIKDSGGNVKVQAQASGAIHSGVSTFQDIDVDGHTNLDNVSIAGVTTISSTDLFVKPPTVSSSRIKLGYAEQMKISVSSSNQNVIQSTAAYLQIANNNLLFARADTNLNMASFKAGQQCKLTYNYVDRIATSGIGATVYGQFDTTNLTIAGVSTFTGNIDANGDLDVDGHTNLDNVSIAGVTTFTGNADFSSRLQITSNAPYIDLIDSDNNPDFRLVADSGNFLIYEINNAATRFQINSDGHVDITGNLDVGAGLDVTGNATVSGDIDVDGHTNLDNVSIAGISTFSGIVDATNTPASIRVAQDIQHKGDADTKITFPANDTISFDTAGSERLRIDSSGNIKLSSDVLQTLAVKNYGYSGSYKSIMVGNPNSNSGTVALCVDVSAISGSSFHAQNQVITGYRGFLTPNAAGNNFIGVFARDASANKIYFGPSTSGGITNGPITASDNKVGINQTSPQTGLHINQDWVNSYGSISVEGSANALVGLGLRSNGNYRASLIWRDGSSGNYLDIATYGAAYPILFRPNGTEKVRITGGGDLEMTGGTVSLKEHMIRVGNRTTSQINAGVSTATGSLTLDTTDNNLKYYANAKWRTVKQQGNDGSTQSLAARSAKALLDDGITANGVYWLDMHGAYSLGNAKLHYCLMDTSYDGGGWTMLYSMNHGNNFASGSNYSFSVNVGSPTTVNDFTAGNWGYDRRNTFTPAANDQFLIRRSDNNDWKRFVVSVWSPTYNNVSNGWETLNKTDGNNTGHPYWALGQMYNSSGSAVSNHIHFNGCAKGGNCNSGGGDGSGFGEYSQWLNGEGHSSYGGAYNSQSAGGSPLYWGQGNALTQGGSLYIQMFYRKAGTQ